MEKEFVLLPEEGKEKKFYVETSIDDGETWSSSEPFDSRDEASRNLRNATHSGADSYGIQFRVVEK